MTERYLMARLLATFSRCSGGCAHVQVKELPEQLFNGAMAALRRAVLTTGQALPLHRVGHIQAGTVSLVLDQVDVFPYSPPLCLHLMRAFMLEAVFCLKFMLTWLRSHCITYIRPSIAMPL